jgi:hypothetical protein
MTSITAFKKRLYTGGDPLQYTLNPMALTATTTNRQKQLQTMLKKQSYYQKHREPKPSRFSAIMNVPSLGQNFFMDTFTVAQLAGSNRKIRYILVVVDGFSRLLSCALLRSKDVAETRKGLEHILDQLNNSNLLAFSFVIGCDQDTTYFSKEMTTMLADKYRAYCYKLRAPKKSFLAEVFGKLVMQKIYRHLTATGGSKYYDVFDSLILAINKQPRKELCGMSAV